MMGAVLVGAAAGMGLAVLARGTTNDLSVALARMRARIERSALRRRRADLELLGLVADDLVVRQVLGAIVGAASVVAVGMLGGVVGRSLQLLPVEPSLVEELPSWDMEDKLVRDLIRNCTHQGADARLSSDTLFPPGSWPRRRVESPSDMLTHPLLHQSCSSSCQS
jgi:hypothetical protein